jgi:hypothetical protein
VYSKPYPISTLSYKLTDRSSFVIVEDDCRSACLASKQRRSWSRALQALA